MLSSGTERTLVQRLLVRGEVSDVQVRLFEIIGSCFMSGLIRRRSRWIVVVLALVFVGATVFFLLPPPPPRHGTRGSRPSMQQSELPGDAGSIVSSPTTNNTASASQDSAVTLIGTNELAPKSSMKETWTRFRGPLGQGVSDDANIPMEWSDQKNLKWKTPMPGAGASSPILTDTHVILTTYSGYGLPGNNQKVSSLERQLHCIDRSNGNILWSKSIETKLPEDPFQGNGLPEHGYATNTPATDGNRIYAFFGKSGVYAFDMDGNEKWRASVGTSSGNRGWGTAASVVLYKNLVIVNAAEESRAIYGLDKESGNVVWKAPADSLELCYGTPTIVRVNDQREDLVIGVPGEVWGLNPNTGKLIWYAETSLTGNLASVIVDGSVVYVFGGFRSSGSLALRVDEQSNDNVTSSHVLWTARSSSYVATPVLHQRRLYWIDDRGQYFCMDATNGEAIDKARVPNIDSKGRPVYASPIVIDGKIFAQSRSSGMYVLAPGDKLKVLANNRFARDESIFNAIPAVSNGQLFVRSDTYLYCITRDGR